MKIIVSLVVLLTSLLSQTTLCYKKDSASTVINKNEKLQGQLCQDTYSLNDMKSFGWALKESKTVKKPNGYDHIYVLQNTNEIKIKLDKPDIDFNLQNIKIYDVTASEAKVDMPNLKEGQSGIIVHDYENDDSIILSYATVINSNDKFSTIKILNQKPLLQDAIPNTNLKPTSSDNFVLNHLYKTSLLIVPNLESKRYVKLKFNTQNFLNEDFFASHLKLNETPLPSKNDIQEFCKNNQIGTVFVVVDQTIYVIDAISFKILHSEKTTINDDSSKLPFFTKIQKIDKSFFSSTFDFFDFDIDLNPFNDDEDESIEKTIPLPSKDYNSYYSAMIGVN